MWAHAERQMPIGLAGDVENLRIAEVGFVAIGRREPGHHERPARDARPGDRDVLARDARARELQRARVPQELFNGRCGEGRVGLQQGPLLRMLDQG